MTYEGWSIQGSVRHRLDDEGAVVYSTLLAWRSWTGWPSIDIPLAPKVGA